jgi:hypothetical protein
MLVLPGATGALERRIWVANLAVANSVANYPIDIVTTKGK